MKPPCRIAGTLAAGWCALALAGAAAAAAPGAPPRPNIVLILADDLGYGDVGVQARLETIWKKWDADNLSPASR